MKGLWNYKSPAAKTSRAKEYHVGGFLSQQKAALICVSAVLLVLAYCKR